MQISILTVNILTKPNKAGKTYQVADLAFKNLTFGGKVEGKQLFGFGAQEDAFKVLSNAQAGDVYDVEVKKNTQGFNDWISATKGSAADANTQATSGASSGSKAVSSTSTTRSTYETPEERAKKQVYIVRQSSLATAERILSVGAKSPPKVEDIMEIAKKLEGYVFGVGTTKAQEQFPDVPDFPNEAE